MKLWEIGRTTSTAMAPVHGWTLTRTRPRLSLSLLSGCLALVLALDLTAIVSSAPAIAFCPKGQVYSENLRRCAPCPAGTAKQREVVRGASPTAVESCVAASAACGTAEYVRRGACRKCPADQVADATNANCVSCPAGAIRVPSGPQKNARCETQPAAAPPEGRGDDPQGDCGGAEVCNGIDDDCNGVIDDVEPITCLPCGATAPGCRNGAANLCAFECKQHCCEGCRALRGDERAWCSMNCKPCGDGSGPGSPTGSAAPESGAAPAGAGTGTGGSPGGIRSSSCLAYGQDVAYQLSELACEYALNQCGVTVSDHAGGDLPETVCYLISAPECARSGLNYAQSGQSLLCKAYLMDPAATLQGGCQVADWRGYYLAQLRTLCSQATADLHYYRPQR